jgi:hypothetical protein
VRWARYVNRYAHIPLIVVGGCGAYAAIQPFDKRWCAVRRQAKHPYGWAGRAR